MTEEVVVHAPEEFGPKNAAGVGVLKPITRKETKISPLVIVGIVSGIITVLVVAVVLRSLEQVSPWVIGAVCSARSARWCSAATRFCGTTNWSRIAACP